jgi:hypothetical protein
MERFVRRQNLANYKKLLFETSDKTLRRMLLKMIAEEEAKEPKPINGG